jgi:hypothetical protein
MDKRIVINTGPLIALMRMKALEIPGKLDLVFVTPEEVRRELDDGVSAGYPKVKPYLDHALQTDIRYHPDLVHRFLEALGERSFHEPKTQTSNSEP